MCAVSNVMDGWMRPGPNYVAWTTSAPEPATAVQMLKVIELLEQIDKKLNAIECKVKEKDKAAYKRKLKRRATGAGSSAGT